MYLNVTLVNFPSTNSSTPRELWLDTNYWALVLVVFPLVTFFGNVLVVISVYRERALRTITNYFIVSLAVADLMVAVLVMPPGIYVELNQMQWSLGDALCDTWVAFDVMCCTASILNLVAISVDRFIAVTQPIKYAKHKNTTRVCVMIAASWAASAAISLPIPFVNYTPQRHLTPTRCAFYNSDFLIFSSMGSFYIPCVVMLYLYGRIFRVIRQRARSLPSKRCANADAVTLPTDDVEQTDVDDVSTIHGIRNTAACVSLLDGREGGGIVIVNSASVSGYSSPSAGIRSHLLEIPRNHKRGTDGVLGAGPTAAGPTKTLSSASEDDDSDSVNRRLSAASPDRGRRHRPLGKLTSLTLTVNGGRGGADVKSSSGQQLQHPELTDEGEDDVPPSPASPSCTSSDMATISKLVVVLAPRAHVQRAKQNMAAGISMLLTKRRRKQRVSSRKEKKATKTLAIVLGVFLICWAPFFTVNIIDAICIRYKLGEKGSECHIPSLVFSCAVWLGYINSALNPVIYTIFNNDFRRAFKRILLHLVACSR